MDLLDLRDRPYRLFFPLGLILAWAGVMHWLLHALGLLPDYRSVFHAIVQVEGFLTCLAAGFLLTAVPRRTGTPRPAGWQIAVIGVAPVVVTAFAWLERWAWSQVAWLVLAFTLLGFLLPRVLGKSARRRPPLSFVWLPAALLMGIAGSVMTGARALGEGYVHLHDIGKGLVLQGMVLGLVLGVGGLVIPLMTRGEAPRDATRSRRDLAIMGLHLLGAALVAASFFVEAWRSVTAGMALRGGVALVALVAACRLHIPPTRPGWNRWGIWLSAWMVPLGYGLAAALPETKKAGLHVVFIGGFALLALAVSAHVILSHADDDRTALRDGRPWQAPAMVALLLAAAALRALVDWVPAGFMLWLGLASCCFLLATLAWFTLTTAPAEAGAPLEETKWNPSDAS